MMDPIQLLREYAERGSEGAFREVVNRYVDLVFSVALRQTGGHRAMAEEIVQTVFTDLARHVARGRGPLSDPSAHLGGWLHRHTCFAAANARRSEKRRLAREKTAADMNTLHSEPNDSWEALAPALDEAVQRLPSADRDAIVLRFYERLDLRPLGRRLGISDDAAQKRVSRALERLRDLLAARGAMLTVAALATCLSERAVQAAPAGMAETTA